MATKRNKKGQFVTDTSKETYDGMGVFYDHKGYAKVWKDGKNKMVHILEWEKHFGKKPKGMVVHHKDGDKSNWDIDNLELLSHSDHQRLHAGWVRDENDNWVKKPCTRCGEVLPLDEFYERKTLKHNTQSGMCKECAKDHHKERATEEYKAKRKEYMKKYYRNNKEKWGIKDENS